MEEVMDIRSAHNDTDSDPATTRPWGKIADVLLRSCSN